MCAEGRVWLFVGCGGRCGWGRGGGGGWRVVGVEVAKEGGLEGLVMGGCGFERGGDMFLEVDGAAMKGVEEVVPRDEVEVREGAW